MNDTQPAETEARRSLEEMSALTIAPFCRLTIWSNINILLNGINFLP